MELPSRPARSSSGLAPRPFLTSSSVILPVEPEPLSLVTSTPISRASFLVAGVASTPSAEVPSCLGAWTCWLTVASGLPVACAGFEAVCWPSTPESMTIITCPTFTVSPSLARILDTLPVHGEGICTLTLSVITSTSGCSSFTLSPSLTNHFRISPSAMPSPMSGKRRSIPIKVIGMGV